MREVNIHEVFRRAAADADLSRLNCVVPGCKRTRGQRKGEVWPRYAEWICGPHWDAVPKLFRRALHRALRAYRLRNSANGWRRHDRLWKRIKRAAIEKAAGIG